MPEDNTFDDPCYVISDKDPSVYGHYSGFKPNHQRRVPVIAQDDPTQKRVWATATLDADGTWLEIVVTRSDGKTQPQKHSYADLMSILLHNRSTHT